MKNDRPRVAINWEQLNSFMIWLYVVVYIDEVQVLGKSASVFFRTGKQAKSIIVGI